jgi:hypothetical protein
MRLSIGIIKGTGLVIQNPENTPLYQPLRAGHGDLHLYWQPVYQDVIRSVGPLAAFLPSATFEGSGEKVVFSHIEAGKDILSLTRPLSRSEGIPEDVLGRLDSAIKSFKAIAHRDGTSPDVRRFVDEFTLPSIARFPDAYRVYEPGLFSAKRYFILWGFEPFGVSDVTRHDIGQVQTELQRRGTSSRSGPSSLVRALVIACIVAAVSWLIAFILLPRPEAMFTLSAEAGKMAIVDNQTKLHKRLGVHFGQTAFAWTFEGVDPGTSDRESPEPTWTAPGRKLVTLRATHSSILWLSKSHATDAYVDVAAAPIIPPIPPDFGNDLPPVLPRPPDLDDGSIRKKSTKGSDADTSGEVAKNPDDAGKAVPGLPRDEASKGNTDSNSDGVTKSDESQKTDRTRDEGDGAGVNPPPGSQQGSEAQPRPNGKPGTGTQPKDKPPEVIPISGGVRVIWFNSRADGVDGKRLWVSLDIEPPSGYKVESFSFDGRGKKYTGPFEQLVEIGPNLIEVVLTPTGSSGNQSVRRSTITFNRPFDVLDDAGDAAPRAPGSPRGGQEPRATPNVDPNKVPDLSPSESA